MRGSQDSRPRVDGTHVQSQKSLEYAMCMPMSSVSCSLNIWKCMRTEFFFYRNVQKFLKSFSRHVERVLILILNKEKYLISLLRTK